MTQGAEAHGSAESSGKSSGPMPWLVWARTLVFAGEMGLTLSEAVVGVRLGVGKHLGMSCGDHLSGLQTQEHDHLRLSEMRPLLLKCLFSAQSIMSFISEVWL